MRLNNDTIIGNRISRPRDVSLSEVPSMPTAAGFFDRIIIQYRLDNSRTDGWLHVR